MSICVFYSSHLQFFFFNDTATTEIYTYWHTLSLHDALPIYACAWLRGMPGMQVVDDASGAPTLALRGAVLPQQLDDGRRWLALADLIDRKSTRLNSSH